MKSPESQPIERAENNGADATIGVRLKRLREQNGLSIREVSSQTHISISNLTAIEEEAFEQLPADTFIRGHVAIYGNFLGLDGHETARLFLEERDRLQPRRRKNRGGNSHSLKPKKLAEPSHVSSATVASVLLLLIVVTLAAFCLYTGWNPFSYFLEKEQASTVPGSGMQFSSGPDVDRDRNDDSLGAGSPPVPSPQQLLDGKPPSATVSSEPVSEN